LLDSYRPLRVVTQGEARDAEDGGLLLDTPGVGEDQTGMGQQLHEIEVAERFGQSQVRRRLPRVALQRFASTRVDWEDDRQLTLEALDGLEQTTEDLGVVHVGRAVQREDTVGAPAQTDPLQDR